MEPKPPARGAGSRDGVAGTADAADAQGLTVHLRRSDAGTLDEAEAESLARQLRQTVLRAALDAILIVDEAGRIIEFNPAAEGAFRRRRSQVLGRTVTGTLLPQWAGEIQALEGTGAPALQRRIETTAVRADGSVFPVEISVSRVQHQSRFFHILHLRDLTESQQAKDQINRLTEELQQRIEQRTDQLREVNATLEREVSQRRQILEQFQDSEARYKTLVDLAPEALNVLDVDTGRFIEPNPASLRMLGYTREEFLTFTTADVSVPEQPQGFASRDEARRKIEEALNGGVCSFEWLLRCKDGRQIPCEILLTRIPVAGRRLVRITAIDITDRIQREKIQRAVYRISEAAHGSDDLGGLYRQIHQIIGELMPARNFYIALHDTDTDLIHFPYYVDVRDPTPQPRPPGRGLTERVMGTGQPLLATPQVLRSLAARGVIPKGSPALIWLGVPLRIQGRPIGVMAIQDYENPEVFGDREKEVLFYVAEQVGAAISRKSAERELHRALAKERELGELKSRFVSMVSHEFRNPLGVILSSAEILDHYLDRLPPERRHEQLADIQAAAHRMSRIMEEVLLLSRVESGRFTLKPSPVSLRSFLEQLSDEAVSATRTAHPVRVEFEDAPDVVHTDPSLLRHVLLNLLSNAIKYSQLDEPVLLKATRSPLAVGGCRIEVADDGIGIPASDQAHLFEAFHRGTNVGERPGTGLGLTIVKRCADVMQARVSFETEEGRGSRFRIDIPGIPSPEGPPAIRSSGPEDEPPRSRGSVVTQRKRNPAGRRTGPC